MSNDLAHTETYKGFTINIYNDNHPHETPRDWDNLGTMICWHRNYNLGDKHNYKDSEDFVRDLVGDDYWEASTEQEERELCKVKGDIFSKEFQAAQNEISKKYSNYRLNKLYENYELLPLYLYDHSGITMNTSGYHCPWDSGQVGWIYISKEKIRKEYKVKRISKKLMEKVRQALIQEVETYDEYLRGEIYGYEVLDADGEHLDSCWGFYGYEVKEEDWYVLQEARAAADYAEKKKFPLFAKAGILGENYV